MPTCRVVSYWWWIMNILCDLWCLNHTRKLTFQPGKFWWHFLFILPPYKACNNIVLCNGYILYRKLQTGIPSSIHCKDTWGSCVQPTLSCFLHRTTFWTTTNLASEVATQLRLPYSRLQRPWDWQEQLPNPLYSSCWICLLPLTQLTTRSSCPSSERWASQEPPSCGSSLTSQIGPSGCLGGVRFQSHNFLLLEFLKAQCLDHFSSPATCRH